VAAIDPIRVMIVDDQPVVRSGLAAFLLAYDDLELVAEASNGEQAVGLCQQACPDVVLMDLLMPGMDGVATTRAIRAACPDSQIVILTSFREGTLVQEALQAGAISYLLKNASAGELIGAIRAAHAGRMTLAPEATQALVRAARAPEPAVVAFTGREWDVLRLMAQGLSNPEIAQKLIVSRSTVKFHVGHILEKLGAANRAEAVARAIQQRLVD
jgi:NarL family two-component system response regulator LiaR